MKKTGLVILVVFCVMIGFSVGYLFRDTTKKDVEVIEQSSNYEVYEEFAANKVLEIYVDTVNVNLQVVPSNNRNVRMIYRPSVEPSNFTYYIENKVLYMHVDEVEPSNSLVPSNREMVYLYLPSRTDVSLHFVSNSGFLDINQVGLRNVFVQTKSGIVSMSNVNVALDVDIDSNAGKVILKEIDFDNLKVKTNTALISCVLLTKDASFSKQYLTKNGTIKVNDEVVSNDYIDEQDSMRSMYLETRSGDIRVKMEETVYEE